MQVAVKNEKQAAEFVYELLSAGNRQVAKIELRVSLTVMVRKSVNQPLDLLFVLGQA